MSTPTGPAGNWSTFVTTIAYPSRWTKYSSGYTWWGQVPTTDSSGASVCSWAPYYFTAHSTYVTTSARKASTGLYTDWSTVTSGAYVTYLTVRPIGEETQQIDPKDPGGLDWEFDVGVRNVEKPGVPPPYDEQSVPQYCSMGVLPLPPGQTHTTLAGNAPAEALMSVQYLTFTSTLHEDTPPSNLASLTTLAKVSSSTKQSSSQQTASQTYKQLPMTASPSSTEKQPLSTTNTEMPAEKSTRPLATEQPSLPGPSTVDSSSGLQSSHPASSAVEEPASSSPSVKASMNSAPIVTSLTASPEEQESPSLSRTETSIHQQVQQSSILASGMSADGISANSHLSITETHIGSAPRESSLAAPSTSSPLATGTAAGETAEGETGAATTVLATGAAVVVVGPATLSQVPDANSSPNAAGSDQASNIDSLTATLPDSTTAAGGVVVVAIGGQTLSSAGQTATLSGSNDASNDASSANEQATGTAHSTQQQQQQQQQQQKQPTLAVLQTDSAGRTQLLVGDSTVVSDVALAYATGANTAAAMDGVVIAATSAAVTSATDAVQGQGQGQGQGTTTTDGRQTVEAANSAGASEVETSASSASGGQTVSKDDNVGGRK
ncbi:hypothetical protein DBV05_g12326 [Lasiodiplodia theobromae]|uniref:Uncharacterized protein n=1 Tax=Lasiodiplodia theobromae TaxID=45133 RepID=A0A5N5CUG5_9PEZI|nr:hypothetical protein DBV05_g12326 [Lasiodiplodia theobromae]